MSSGSTDRDVAPPPLRDRARERIAAGRARYQASWAAELGRELKALDFVNWITVFGASLLWSALPLILLLSSLADQRVDDDLSRHMGSTARARTSCARCSAVRRRTASSRS